MIMRKTGLGVLMAAGVAVFGLAPVASAATAGRAAVTATLGAHVRLSPATGPPASTVTVSGARFGASEAVDIYFDTTDEALVTTKARGAFSGITITVPASAAPGTHWITAVGRHSGQAAQAAFTVSTDWAQFNNGPSHRGDNTTENVLGPSNVSNLGLNWSYTTGGPVQAPPAVASGIVYAGSNDGKMYALNAATGRWCGPTPPAAASIPRPRWSTGSSTPPPRTATCMR
jgi:hypothetical protein